MLLPVSAFYPGQILDRIVAYGEEDIIITMSDILIARIQNNDFDTPVREIIETLAKKEAFIKYVRRTSMVKVNYREVEEQYRQTLENSELMDMLDRYGLDPVYLKINLEKQLYIYKFIEHSFLASTVVTREEIESFIRDNPEYRNIIPDDSILREIEAKIKEQKVDERIQNEIKSLMGNIHYAVDPEHLDL